MYYYLFQDNIYLLPLSILPRYSPISSNSININDDLIIIENKYEIKKDNEIYLDYGMELSNWELLSYYGLLMNYNPYNIIQLKNNNNQIINISSYFINKNIISDYTVINSQIESDNKLKEIINSYYSICNTKL